MNRPSSSQSLQSLREFYIDHLQTVLLPFWLRSVDWEDGGYYNCYDNSGSTLVSDDKYTWSQGRFVWIYAKLASLEGGVFAEGEQKQFLNLAAHGARFLMDHSLLENGNCTFLMDKKGNPKRASDEVPYDSSIFADCFAAAGLAKYAAVAKDADSLDFARKIYDSILKRYQKGSYHMAPYPTPEGYKSHNIPMIMLNLTQELLEAEEALGAGDAETGHYRKNLKQLMDEIMVHFADDQGVLNEMIGMDNSRLDSLLGRYCNPGHVIEDMWFVIHASLKIKDQTYVKPAAKITKKMFELGWDSEYGGLLLFVDREGGKPTGDKNGHELTPMVQQIEQNWDNKLWWPHSEALYTSLLCYKLTQDEAFMDMYGKVHDYTFLTFPNPDKEIGEWIQIRKRNGEPIHKVVALPVKDPFHIIRNFIYVIELLDGLSMEQHGMKEGLL